MRNTRLPALPLAASLLLLTACAVPRPAEKVEAPTPPHWSTPLPPSTAALPHGGSLPTLAEWWEQLHDPLLVELINSSEAASPTVASAGARIAEARATRIAAGAALVPNLNGSLSASRGNSPTTGLTGTTGGAANARMPSASSGRAGGAAVAAAMGGS